MNPTIEYPAFEILALACVKRMQNMGETKINKVFYCFKPFSN
jgi:hypothetical protein